MIQSSATLATEGAIVAVNYRRDKDAAEDTVSAITKAGGFAKAYALGLGIPLIGVNHLEADLYSLFIDGPHPPFPFLCLIVSGGHTQLARIDAGFQVTTLGRTRDESLQGRVEICVIGTTDLGSRNFTRREHKPVAPPRKSDRPAGATTTTAEPGSTTNVTTRVTPEPGRASRQPAGAAAGAKPQQEEFGFKGGPTTDNRGTFDKSDRNLFEGQDLDIPTYLRKGIKVTV